MQQTPKSHPLQQVLLSPDGASAHLSELMLFGQFEGAWDLDVEWLDKGTVVRRDKGEWHFGWILGGRAIQDVWIVPPRRDQTGDDDLYEYGTSVRFFDEGSGAWRSTWIGPVQGSVRTFLARKEGDEIVLQGEHLDGREIKWVFSNISKDKFSWRFKARTGDEWETIQSFECTRVQ